MCVSRDFIDFTPEVPLPGAKRLGARRLRCIALCKPISITLVFGFFGAENSPKPPPRCPDRAWRHARLCPSSRCVGVQRTACRSAIGRFATQPSLVPTLWTLAHGERHDPGRGARAEGSTKSSTWELATRVYLAQQPPPNCP